MGMTTAELVLTLTSLANWHVDGDPVLGRTSREALVAAADRLEAAEQVIVQARAALELNLRAIPLARWDSGRTALAAIAKWQEGR